MTQMSFAQMHADAAQADPQVPCLVFPDRTFTHDQVARLGRAFAGRMAEAGIGAGDRVQLRTPDATLVIATFLATSWLGAQFVPYPGEGGLPPEIAPTHYLFDPRQRPSPAEGAIAITAEWSPHVAPAFTPAVGTDYSDQDWLWVHTTGTTGVPKFLVLTQAMVVGRSRAVSDEFRRGSRHVLLAHVYSRPFFARAAAALLNLSALYFELTPADWHGAGINMVSGSRSLARTALAGTTLSPKLPKLELAGSRLPEAEAVTFLGSFDLVDDTYGASETSKSYSTLWSLDADGNAVAQGHGRDSEIQVIDQDETEVAPGTRGIVRIRNPYMAQGYLNDPRSSAEAFRDGWFYPGDVAYRDETGRLRFADRADHVINIMGNKINAFYVDQLLASARGIREAICFRNPKPGAEEELFAFVVFDEEVNRLQAVASAKYAVSEKLGATMVPRVMQPVPGIPRKPDGEPDRQACARMVLEVAAKRANEPQIT